MKGPIPLLCAILACMVVAGNAVLGAIVAPVLFHMLDERAVAGLLFGTMLQRYEALLLAGGGTVAVGSLVMALRGQSAQLWLRGLALVGAAALSLSLWLLHRTSAEVHAMRDAKRVAPPEDPIHATFERAHHASERWYSVTTVMLLGAAGYALVFHLGHQRRRLAPAEQASVQTAD